MLGACTSTVAGTATEGTGALAVPSSPPSSSSPSAAGAPTSTAGPTRDAAGPVTDLGPLALTATDFPPPFVYQPVSAKDVAAAGTGLPAGAAFDPPACSKASSSTGGANLSGAGLALAIDEAGGVILVETVTKGGPSISTVPDLVKKCASFTVTAPQIGVIKYSIVQLDPPVVDADATVATKVSGTVTVAGKTVAIELVSYVAELRGVQVTAGATSDHGAPIDSALLQQLLKKGVAKVRAG